MSQIPFGEPIPEHSLYAISVSFPTWQDNIAYEKAEPHAINSMKSGYPRFFISLEIKKLASKIEPEIAKQDQSILILPTKKSAERCSLFIQDQAVQYNINISTEFIPEIFEYHIVHKLLPSSIPNDLLEKNLFTPVTLYLVIVHNSLFFLAKQYWQHTGDGISSRQANYCNHILEYNKTHSHSLLLHSKPSPSPLSPSNSLLQNEFKTPSYYKKPKSHRADTSLAFNPDNTIQTSEHISDQFSESLPNEHSRFIEERFGRNLSSNMAINSKAILKKRIAGLIIDSNLDSSSQLHSSLNTINRNISLLSEADVFLTSTGMGAIFNTHRIILNHYKFQKSICFGFVYTDTLKILQKFGPGAYFFGHGEGSDYDKLEKTLLDNPNSIAALFTEFPSNPLLKSSDLSRLRILADKFGFILVVDDTIGNFVNLNLLPLADVVVSSLTKLFSGDSNVMGGSIILNPKSLHYPLLKTAFNSDLEDNLWWEDSIFLERNSRNFVERNRIINRNAELIFFLLSKSVHVEKLFYPKITCNQFYEAVKRNDCESGYGGLLSIVFKSEDLAKTFYDNLKCAKGPSLGTNFTLASPYTILAHFNELDWAHEYGVSPYLIRVSIGLENKDTLHSIFYDALQSLD
ncbi:hypothetical protein BB561_000887 [Smittium simulii]|uniref:Cystathionine gamma-synthase n=1 Tax=Smittium simulii TaxID=133385 RepID=A0A2T9YX85_9FUNG|nr:hypothetical protein BB561_000887 [Smittium simulii]